MPKIIAITVNTTPVRYVSTTTNRKDKSIVAETTTDKNQAHDFVTAENANAIIPRIVNPFERVFTAVELEVEKRHVSEFDEFVFN